MSESGPCEIRDATVADLPAIRDIYNREIETGVATFDLDPWSDATAQAWFAGHAAPYCLLVAVDAAGDVLGFGALSAYQARPGFRLTVEDTVYVRPDRQRNGIGRQILAALIDRARRGGLHVLIGRIEGENRASIGLHLALGFFEAGREREVGYKHGRWLDVVTVELLLS